jgi:hypothetical protein
MDDNSDIIVPVTLFILIFGSFIVGRVLKHRERMQMLRMGIIPPRDLRKWQKRGGPWMGAGMPPPMPGMPMQGMPPQGYAPYEDPDSAQCTMRAGIKTSMVGLALLIGLSLIGYNPDQFPPFHPGPWLLGGLIPLFVGIAQIIIAVMAGATFGLRQMPPPPMPPGPPPPPGPGSYGAPHPGQPGIRYEELARPVKPPDRI